MNAKKNANPSTKKAQSAKRASPTPPPLSKKKTKFKLSKASLFSESPVYEPELAIVRELTGFAVLALPRELRDFLGDESTVSEVQDLESHELLLIVRNEGRVAFVHLPFIVREMESPVTDLRAGGVVLRDFACSGTPMPDADGLAANASSRVVMRTSRAARHA